MLLKDSLSDPHGLFLFLPVQIVIWERITCIYEENNVSENGKLLRELQYQLFTYVLGFWIVLILRKWANIFFTAIFRAILEHLRGKMLLWARMGRSPAELEMVTLNKKLKEDINEELVCVVYVIYPFS